MDEKLKEYAQKMEAALARAKEAQDADAVNEAMDEYDSLSKAYEAHERVIEAEKAAVLEKAQPVIENKQKEDSYEKAVRETANYIRKGFSEGVSADGGYTVPEDISTKIEQYRDATAHLRQFVTVENVKTLTGERTFQRRGHGAGFSSVSEGGKLPKITNPQFERISYTIQKYGGYMFSTNELLEDTDANIVSVIIKWFGDNARVTDNQLILTTLNEKYTRTTNPATAATIATLDDIKSVLNVTLGQTFAPTSTIVTNDNGLQWLDTLKDDSGDYLLKKDNIDPLKQYLAVGFRMVPLTILPNGDLPNDTTSGIPFYIGDLKEAAILFDRKALQLKASDTASIGTGDDAINAFGEDLRIWRGIERMDCVLRDENAFVLGYKSNNAG